MLRQLAIAPLVANGRLGNYTALQAAYYADLRRVNMSVPEGLLASLGYAITRPGNSFHLHQAQRAAERSGVSGLHQWSVMLPTSARVSQEVYEPLLGIQYPMLCSHRQGQWHIGTTSIRANDLAATGLRFVNWQHQDDHDAARADPPPSPTISTYHRRGSKETLPLSSPRRGTALSRSKTTFNGKKANAETAVKVAGATARHCIILHGRSNFLSGSGHQEEFDNECYTRANVAYSRATDLTVLACPVNMQGIPGALQVIAALLHGVCTIHTGSKNEQRPQVKGRLHEDTAEVQTSTAAFAAAINPHSLWQGLLLVCLVEHHLGVARRLRLVLAHQSLLYTAEMSSLPSSGRVFESGLLFGYAPDGRAMPDWLVIPDNSMPAAWRLLHNAAKAGERFSIGSTIRYPPGQETAANHPCRHASPKSGSWRS